ncbi:MAG: hypothetical protein ACYDCO_11445 [Armatimonadota bacterium]
MANCPRCGAVNRPGKVACWKCLAPIPPPPPAQPTPPTPPPEPKLAVPFRRLLNVPDLTVAFPRRRAHADGPEPAPVVEPEAPEPIPEEVVEAAAEPAIVIPEEAAPVPEVITPGEDIPTEASVEEEPPAAEAIPAEPPVDEIIEEPLVEEPVVEPVEEALPADTFMETVLEEIVAEPAPEEIFTEPVDDEPEPGPVASTHPDTPFALADEEDAPAPEDAPAKPARSFIYMAGAAFPRKDRTWISVMVILTLLIASIFVLYHHNFRDKPRPTTPQQAAQEYLFYLRDNDRFSQQQLATPKSKGLCLPAWFTILEVQLVGVGETDGGARATARLQLAPTNSFDLTPALASLASRSYGVEFTLERGRNSWRVDQRTLFRSLRWKMKQADPKVTLPPWDGVSQ